jgi:hypothetical protein
MALLIRYKVIIGILSHSGRFGPRGLSFIERLNRRGPFRHM